MLGFFHYSLIFAEKNGGKVQALTPTNLSFVLLGRSERVRVLLQIRTTALSALFAVIILDVLEILVLE